MAGFAPYSATQRSLLTPSVPSGSQMSERPMSSVWELGNGWVMDRATGQLLLPNDYSGSISSYLLWVNGMRE